jgi:hypothetical protein
MKQSLLLLPFVSLSLLSFGQIKTDTALNGVWRGESICQIKSSPCHDEIAVYHLTKLKEPNMFRFVANKVVDGKEVAMGILDFTYHAKDQTLTCDDAQHSATWRFELNGDEMNGTLMYKGELYRVIHLKKE